MPAAGLEILAMVMSVMGWIISIVACALPMWKVTAFIGASIVTAQVIWEGLWMSCVVQSTGQMQCKIYDSILALPQDLQAARALVVVSILLGILALLISIVGAKCTNCIEDKKLKRHLLLVSAVGMLVSGGMQLVPATWSAHTIITHFHSPGAGGRWELGVSLYLCWASAVLLLLGGTVLCCARCHQPPPTGSYTTNNYV